MEISLAPLWMILQPTAIGLCFMAYILLLLSVMPFGMMFRKAAYTNAAVGYLLVLYFKMRSSDLANDFSLVFSSDRLNTALVFGVVGWTAAFGFDYASKKFPLMPRWGFFLQFLVIGMSVAFLYVSVSKTLI